MFSRLSIFLLLLLICGCKPPATRPSHATVISPGMAHNLILQQSGNTSFKIVDVRTPSEFSSGHIQGAINIDWVNDRKRLMTLSKTDTLLVYCQSGRRSALAVAYLKDHGFSYLFNMSGGLIQWKKDIKYLSPSPSNEV